MMFTLSKGFRKTILAAIICMMPVSFVVAGTMSVRPVDHPSKLVYPKLDWQVPLGIPYRKVLHNGLRAYIASDTTIPVVSITGYVKYGSIAEPVGKEGLSSLYAHLLRSGGTARYPADSLDELLDRLAIQCSFSVSETQLEFKYSFLSEETDTALSILREMLVNPVFNEQRLKKTKDVAIQGIRHRFDNPGPVLSAAYESALYPKSANSRLSTAVSIAAISRNDLCALQYSVMAPKNIIVGVSGKFKLSDMEKNLERLFPAATHDSVVPSFPAISPRPAKKVYIVHKDISQAYVRLGIPLFKRPHLDYYPLQVMNTVFGGASFTSRLSSRIRSNEGLTYSIYSNPESNYFYPGTMYIDFHTRNEAAVKVINLINEEFKRMMDFGVTDTELADAKKTLIDVLPSSFRNVEDIVENYAWSEYAGRPDSIYRQYPDNINAVTKEQAQEMAKKYLKFDAFTFVIVGDTAALFSADTSHTFSLRKLKPVIIKSADSLIALP